MLAGLVFLLFLSTSAFVERDFHVQFGSRSGLPVGWHRTERAEATSTVTFIIALAQQNQAQLEALYWDRTNPDSKNYREWLSISEIHSIVAPPKQAHDAVVVWLKDHQVQNLATYGDAIQGTASVATLEQMLGAEFWVYKHINGNQVTNVWGPYHVPQDIAKHIDFISGVNTFPPHINRQKKRTMEKRGIWDDDIYVVPQTAYQMYSIPNTKCVNGSSQGVIEWEDQYFTPADLVGFGQNMAVSSVTNPIVVGDNSPSAPGVEAELDIQWIAATGIGAQNWFWIEPDANWLYGFAVHFMNTQKVPLVASMSYGWSESDQCEDGIGGSECNQMGVNSSQYVGRVNVEFMKIGLRGVTLFASSGDSGVYGRTDEFCEGSTFNPAFPAASPFVTAVGATEIRDAQTSLTNPPPVCQGTSWWWCASGGDEQAVWWLYSGFASGGGFSKYAPLQPFQQAAVWAYLNSSIGKDTPTSYFNPNGRGFPDVAALGSRILIWEGGSSQSVGGTSASSPMFAGVFALLNDYALGTTKKPLGPANPLLYKMAAEHPAAFHDITVGNNRCTESGCGLLDGCIGFNCAPGWDPVTGLGSPVYTEMLKYLQMKLK